MVSIINISRGLDIPVGGAPDQVIDTGAALTTVAMRGLDYLGLHPRLLVEPGSIVALGEAVFVAKHDPAVQFTSPATGRVLAVNRGQRRELQSVEIELDDTVASAKTFESVQSSDRAASRALLLRSGAWSSFRTRPYDHVPDSGSSPSAIFITAIDTRPLAANPNVIVAERADDFRLGAQVVAALSDGPVFLCTGPQWSEQDFSTDRIHRVEFGGPHPAGLPGTHIHHLSPVSAQRTVWHINYQDVIAIGYLFRTGQVLSERIVALGGPAAVRPRLLRTRLGANIQQLLADEISPTNKCRLISGSVLDGAAAEGPMGFLGRYDNQVSVLLDREQRRRFGWFALRQDRYSFTTRLRPTRDPSQQGQFTTAQNGRRVAMLALEVFERVMPLDILPAPLFRALLVKDTDTAQALGCLELAEDDLALSSFVCPAKHNYGAALRINLEQIKREG